MTVGSITEVPGASRPAGAALVGSEVGRGPLADALNVAAAAFGDLDAVGDLNGSADYKRHLAAVLLGVDRPGGGG